MSAVRLVVEAEHDFDRGHCWSRISDCHDSLALLVLLLAQISSAAVVEDLALCRDHDLSPVSPGSTSRHAVLR